MARWDALARSANLPLVRLLGGEPQPVTAYRSRRSMQIDDALQKAEEAVALGFGAIKVKLGTGPGRQDRELLRELRQAVGLRGRSHVRYNQTLPTTKRCPR